MPFWFCVFICFWMGHIGGGALKDPRNTAPLLLTPLIESNRLEEARTQSQVKDLPYVSDVRSHSGYLTVNKGKHNLFFWYFPAMEADSARAPVILWLSGGPGWSGLNAVFVENGPFIVNDHGRLLLRNETWSRHFSVVFVDQPVGTGLSYATNGNDHISGDIASIVTQDMVEFVQQFLKMYDLEKNDFYISGQSYGAKFTTRLATALLQKSSRNENTIKLKGISIGNGFLDNMYFTDNCDYLYQHGFLTINQKKQLERMQATFKNYMRAHKPIAAINLMDSIMLGYFHDPTLFTKWTGNANPSNFMYYTSPKSETYFLKYLNRKDVRRAIHVTDRKFDTINLNVAKNMLADFTVSIAPLLFKLVKGNVLKILIYNGELDLLCPYPITEQLFLSNVKSFANAKRDIWKVDPSDEEVAGFVTQPTRKLSVAMVRGAGHSAPEDQPRRCLDLITRFINDVPY